MGTCLPAIPGYLIQICNCILTIAVPQLLLTDFESGCGWGLYLPGTCPPFSSGFMTSVKQWESGLFLFKPSLPLVSNYSHAPESGDGWGPRLDQCSSTILPMTSVNLLGDSEIYNPCNSLLGFSSPRLLRWHGEDLNFTPQWTLQCQYCWLIMMYVLAYTNFTYIPLLPGPIFTHSPYYLFYVTFIPYFIPSYIFHWVRLLW